MQSFAHADRRVEKGKEKRAITNKITNYFIPKNTSMATQSKSKEGAKSSSFEDLNTPTTRNFEDLDTPTTSVALNDIQLGTSQMGVDQLNPRGGIYKEGVSIENLIQFDYRKPLEKDQNFKFL